MALITTPFFHIECNGPAATPWGKHCSAEVDGGWKQEDVEIDAHAQGWAEDGRKWLCPKHAPAPAEQAPAPRARRSKNEAPPALEDGHQ